MTKTNSRTSEAKNTSDDSKTKKSTHTAICEIAIVNGAFENDWLFADLSH